MQKGFPVRRHASGILVLPAQPPAATLGPTTSAGSRIVKVDPVPTLLSTVTSPPIIWQNFLVIASPSPVHPNWRAVEASACATPGTAWPCVRGSTDTGIADAEGDPLAPSLRLACNRQRHHTVPGKLAGVAKLLQLRPRRASYGSLCPYAIR